MKCQMVLCFGFFFFRKISNLASAEFAQRVVKVLSWQTVKTSDMHNNQTLYVHLCLHCLLRQYFTN